MQRKQWLTHIFFLSVGLNIILFALLLFFTLKEHFFSHTLSFSFTLPRYIEPIPRNHEAFLALQETPFSELIPMLLDQNWITPTAKKCDLALAILVEKYHFAIEEALPTHLLEKEEDPAYVTFYSDLEESDYARLHHYAFSEHYPFSAKGLFYLLQQTKDNPLLATAFMSREPFQLVKKLIQEEGPQIEDLALLGILIEGRWETIEKFYLQQKKKMTLSKTERRRFLQELAKEKVIAGHFIERPAIGKLRPEFREPKERAPDPQKYVVQPGDSLWVIAKRHQLPLEKLKEVNRLQSDTVRVGQSLVIPAL